MREFEFTFDKALINGLRKDASQSINEQALTELYNARPGPLGITSYIPVTPPSNYALVIDWPFPQYFKGVHFDLLALRDRVYEGVVKVVHELDVAGDEELWDFADFGKYGVLCKGSGTVWYRDVGGIGWGPALSIPPCRTACAYNGQVVVGNLGPWGSWTDLGPGYLAWSDIGSAAFGLSRRNQSGFRRVEYDGEVVRVLPLLGSVVAYGYNGVGVLKPVTDPAATFGYINVGDFGIDSRFAVAGTRRMHVFVSSEGDLHKMSAEGNFPELIGYNEFLKPLLGQRLVVVASGNGDFYISDGTKGYLLTQYGLAEIYQRVTSVSFQRGQAVGVSDDSDDQEFRLTTGVIDFGLRGRKTTEVVEVGHQGSGIEAAIDWRMDSSQAFQRTGWQALNTNGAAYLRASGVEFRVALRAAAFEDVKIDYIKLRYKMDDLRSIRGVYAPPPRGQAAPVG